MSSGSSSGALSISPGGVLGEFLSPPPVLRPKSVPKPPPVPPRVVRPIPLDQAPTTAPRDGASPREAAGPRDVDAPQSPEELTLGSALGDLVRRRELWVTMISSLVHMALIVALALFHLTTTKKPMIVLQASPDLVDRTPDLAVSANLEQPSLASGPRITAVAAAAAPVLTPQPRGYDVSLPKTLAGLDALVTSDAATSGGANGMENVSFFGSSAVARRVVFVVDASTSMEGPKFARAKDELLSAVSNLSRYQRFYVIFFADKDYPMQMPRSLDPFLFDAQGNAKQAFETVVPSDMVPFTDRTGYALLHWVRKQELYGDTRPRKALERAFLLKPDVIYLLTDGDFTDNSFDYLMDVRNYRVRLNTIGFQTSGSARDALEKIARKFRGEFVEVQ